ncbi:MAG: aminotransferase class III-fold pyridoxal phosphate-dependent enzyme [Candidatus Peribacteraceae bacterium]|nr:aminotransferase class III-fold pyridoxal phosphate-dependent enzyme [Candidatus Peribacteraceae bacterium]MDD5741923.1 aminotransferase class III-fold pyridoxal phosphate-dependent enzyme [Candidatus Peribacteraceae bacterium]
MRTGQDLYRKAKTLIPGGTQLLSKRPELHLPDNWPSYYSRAKGAEVWDLDGRRFLDMGFSGIGSTVLGFADPDVNAAVSKTIDAGSMCTLNSPEEVELAELLCSLHPWAEMVRYARCGGEAMAIAIRIARAHTGREKIAFCGYHGWHDWYLSANLADDDVLDGHLLPGLDAKGVPRGLKGTMLPFRYNQIGDLEQIIREHGSEIAAVSMEPMRERGPEGDFLRQVRSLATKAGAVLIFDEVTSGFRKTCGGIHLTFGVDPDMAVFAKALGNGFPMAAIIGRRPVMQSAQTTFISSTYWTERIGPTAALATLRKFQKQKVHEHLIRMGTIVQEGWRRAADQAGLPLTIDGMEPLSHFVIESAFGEAPRTLYTQLMLEKGFLALNKFYSMYAHTEEQVAQYLSATEEAFSSVARAITEGTVIDRLQGPAAHAGFKRLTA